MLKNKYTPSPLTDELIDLCTAQPSSIFFAMAELASQRKQHRAFTQYNDVKFPTDFAGRPIKTIDFPADAVKEVKALQLNSDQQLAWTKLVAWLKSDQQFFALKGFAGTGKSFLMQHLLTLDYNFHFSAPTNKASKVLSEYLGEDVKTTYSLLGLRMTANEDKMELTVGSAPDLGYNPIIVIDEAGTVPKIMVDMLQDSNYRVLFVGDPAQLNPVGESRSLVWSLAGSSNRALLQKVERFDNQLLALSIELRESIKTKDFNSPIEDDNDGKEGVFVVSKRTMDKKISALTLDDWRTTKVCCWRNKTVDAYNKAIRKKLGFTKQYEVGEFVLLASPVVEENVIKGYIDEELTIKSIKERTFSFSDGTIEGYTMAVEDRGWLLSVPKDESQLAELLSQRASYASSLTGGARKAAWKKFWELKDAFHNLRYGFALTAHRLQGTTLDHVFVDQADILANPNKLEAFRCLYVAATRPRYSLTTY